MIREDFGKILEKNEAGILLLKIWHDFTEFIAKYMLLNIISIFRIIRLKNKYKGKRCFIIGNGPSLRKTNLSLLKDEYTFGLNKIYLMFEKIGFVPTFYVCTNNLVISQTYENINKLKIPKFINIETKRNLNFDKNTIFLKTVPKQIFPFDPTDGVWEGGTVTYVAMQLAYYMGFSKIILIGVDHSFKVKGVPNEVVVSKGVDKNHFDANYFGKGFKWQLPDLATSETAYHIANYVFTQDNRQILDATVGGKLRIFPKTKLEALFK